MTRCEELDLRATVILRLRLLRLEVISGIQEADSPAVSIDEQAIVLDPFEEQRQRPGEDHAREELLLELIAKGRGSGHVVQFSTVLTFHNSI